MNNAGLTLNERVVGGLSTAFPLEYLEAEKWIERTRIAFLRDSDMRGEYIFNLWTKELRCRAQRITVLPQQISIFLEANLFFMKLG